MSKTRIDLIKGFPKGGVGAELGVFCGGFSRELLWHTAPAELHLVDLFAGMVHSGDQNGDNGRVVDMGPMYWELLTRFAGRPVFVTRGISWQWLERREPGSLDWVYIDTDHVYETMQLELAAARRAVKPGGIIAGHDFDPGFFPGVVKAVYEFSAEHGLPVEIFEGDRLASFKMVNGG